ncbi:hypothetical protein [Streptomyces somaliensis]|nr:hypothetical protein [Streptomyces somaliensis]
MLGESHGRTPGLGPGQVPLLAGVAVLAGVVLDSLTVLQATTLIDR